MQRTKNHTFSIALMWNNYFKHRRGTPCGCPSKTRCHNHRRAPTRGAPTLVNVTLALSFALILSGCLGLRSEHVEQTQYALKVPKAPSPIAKTRYILEVSKPQIAHQFDGLSFVYRYSDINYTSDYYNIFFDSPSEQIHQSIIKYLQSTKFFSDVEVHAFPARPDYLLKSYVTELYADYEDKKSPKAIMTINFILFANSDKPAIVFNKIFSETIQLKQKTSRDLVYGWSNALQKILDRFFICSYSSLKPEIHKKTLPL